MRNFILVTFSLFLPFFSSPGFTEEKSDIFVIEIRGSINPASSDYLRSAIHHAEALGGQALIVELDTPGGLVASVREMAQSVADSTLPVVVYVTPAGAAATSAGALLMLASHFSAMAPGTNIGAAHPVGAQGQDVQGAAGEKAVNDVAAFARGLAELRKRNVKVAEEVVSKSKSMTAKEALKAGFIDLVVSSREDLVHALDGRKIKTKDETRQLNTKTASIRKIEMTLGQNFLHYLAHPNVAAILMSLAMMLIYIELSNPGIGIAGAAGAVCLLIAFMSFQVLPIQTGGIALLVLGMILMAAEPFVASGGALAAGGLVSFLLGMIWMVDPDRTDLKVSYSVIIPAILGLGTGVAALGVAASRIKKLSRATLAKMGGSEMGGLSGYEGRVESVDESGKKGKAAFRGELWTVESENPIQVGDWVVPKRMLGFRILVEPKKEKS